MIYSEGVDKDPPSLIIGIGGAIGSGKDEVAKILTERYGYQRVGFADALKEEVATKFQRTLIAHLKSIGLRPQDGDWNSLIYKVLWEQRTEVTRALLQEYGSDCKRAEDPDYWVNEWKKRVWIRLMRGGRVVVPDCRFENEIEAIRSFGGLYWRVERVVNTPDLAASHVSEHSLEGLVPDATLENNGTIVDLYAQIKARLSGESKENSPWRERESPIESKSSTTS